MRRLLNVLPKSLVFLGVLLHVIPLFAQENLVLNPGFEEALHDKPKSWYNIGSVDYYRNRTLIKNGNDPDPEYPVPFAGNNYIGIRAFDDATELSIGRLKEPLKQGQWYKISCQVFRPLADCNKPVPGISIVLVDSIAKSTHWYGFHQRIPFLLLKPVAQSGKNQLIDGFEWTRVFTYYLAAGGERFIWVGNILGANAGQIKSIGQNAPLPVIPKTDVLHCEYQYYYDEFVVTTTINPHETLLTIRDITFDVGSTAITQMDDMQLKLLLALLADYPMYKVEVTGHTDADGTETANVKLSEKRATAVKNWLTTNGINETRIAAKGMGESRPLFPEDNDAHKALNRRVEIRILH